MRRIIDLAIGMLIGSLAMALILATDDKFWTWVSINGYAIGWGCIGLGVGIFARNLSAIIFIDEFRAWRRAQKDAG